MKFRIAFTLLAALVVAPAHGSDGWQAGLYQQQLALYRLAGTFYMTTNDDSEREYLEALPVRIADYRKSLDAMGATASANRERSQQLAAIEAAWKPVEALVTRNIQQEIGTAQKKYTNNGVFNAFQRATDVNNAMPGLEAAINRALAATGNKPTREELMLQGAVKAESLATHYARLATGYFDDKRTDSGAVDAPQLSQVVRDFEGTMASARKQLNKDDAIERLTFEKIEARWKFVQPALVQARDNRPRVVYRYLNEISENFAKLGRPRS